MEPIQDSMLRSMAVANADNMVTWTQDMHMYIFLMLSIRIKKAICKDYIVISVFTEINLEELWLVFVPRWVNISIHEVNCY